MTLTKIAIRNFIRRQTQSVRRGYQRDIVAGKYQITLYFDRNSDIFLGWSYLKLLLFDVKFNSASNKTNHTIKRGRRATISKMENIVRKVKLTKTRSNTVSIWLITYERIEIKNSAFHRFCRSSVVDSNPLLKV